MNEITLRWVLMAITAVTMIFGFLKGLGRLVALLLVLGAGGAAALAWLRHGQELWEKWTGAAFPAWLLQGGAIASGLLALLLVRTMVGWLTSAGSGGPLTAGARVKGGLGGAIPVLLLLWGGTLALRWLGAAAELRLVEQAVVARSARVLHEPGWLVQVSRALSQGLTGGVLDRVDPVRVSTLLSLGTLLVAQRDAAVYSRLSRQPDTAPVFREPAWRRLKDSESVIKTLSFSQYRDLLGQPEMKAAAADGALNSRLATWTYREHLEAAIEGRASVAPRAEIVPE